MPKFSVIMPSYLEKYSRAASNREEKIVRAIDSVLDQEDFELIVVADGCQKTVDIVKDRFSGEHNLKLFYLPPRKIKGKRNAGASGIVRNAGIWQATGEYIIYLDIDDVYVDGYLENLKKEMTDNLDWYWFDDLSWNVNTKKFDRHGCDIHVEGQCGTSNVCHKRDMNAFWVKKPTYLHDWIFINTLKTISSRYRKLETAGFGILHVPGLLDE